MRESTIGPAGLAAEGIIAANRLSKVKKKPVKRAKKAKKRKPSSLGGNTDKKRDSRGQFVKGNTCSVGNKGNNSKKSSELKQACRLLANVSIQKEISRLKTLILS